jgi:UDP-2,3-diacylglucosamine hydrolase
MNLTIAPGKQVYFLSDFHLGVPDYERSLVREKKIVAFLNEIQHQAAAIFIVGDMFDFWYEYKTTVPKGYTRILGKLAELTDSGIPIHFFVGNHDMWMSGYFEKELNIPVYFHPQTFTHNNKKIYVGHGDGLGPGDNGYKLLKKIFRNKWCHWAFGVLHPSVGMGVANYFSHKSKDKAAKNDQIFLGADKEWLAIFCKEVLQKEHFDFFIFGHRHLPLDLTIANNSRYINLGDWITNFTYATFDGNHAQLHQWSI